jgi:hypothetical protein
MANLLGYCNGDVVNGQAPLLEQVLSHISQSGCRVDGVASDTVLLEIRSRISSLCTYHIQSPLFHVLFLQQQRQENRKLARRDKDEEGEKNVLRTLEMMMPAMLMRTLGPFSNL